MSACEKCWADAQTFDCLYTDLLAERHTDGLCTPEEQAGPDAGECPFCKRMTAHQHTRELMCGCNPVTAVDSDTGPAQAEVATIESAPTVVAEGVQFSRSRALAQLEVHLWLTGGPRSHQWGACLGYYDEGTPTFTGATQREAVNELLDYYEQDNGELRTADSADELPNASAARLEGPGQSRCGKGPAESDTRISATPVASSHDRHDCGFAITSMHSCVLPHGHEGPHKADGFPYGETPQT
jgi:hypothetical protein